MKGGLKRLKIMASEEMRNALEREEIITERFKNKQEFLNTNGKRDYKGKKYKFLHPITTEPISCEEYYQLRRRYLRRLIEWSD